MRTIPVWILLAATVGFAGGASAQEPPKPYDPRAAFAETDKNGDGQIDRQEFADRIIDVFYIADTNKDGFLVVDEYARLPYSGAFTSADSTGDGRLTLSEFERIRFTQFDEADTNKDGTLSVDEVVVVYEGRKQP